MARVTFRTMKEGITCALKEHLAIELLREEGSLAWQLLSERLSRRELEGVRQRIEEFAANDRISCGTSEPFYRAFVGELQGVQPLSPTISTAHALLLILADRTTATSRILERHGVTATLLAADIRALADGGEPQRTPAPRMLDFGSDHHSEQRAQGLVDKFGIDLTREAREGRVDPVVGREEEIERVVQILSRRKKNNPVLVGEAGVGKSAVVEGLALRMASGDVPYNIAGKRLVSLEMSSLVAGTKFRGEFEERMQQLMDELRRRNDVIIFIDEIHTIVGAGSTQGSLDTANILKPALARGEIQTIGATTLDEYRANIEQDAALERRFQRVMVEPATAEQTLEILRNAAPRYEEHHRVRYSDEALRACVELTGRYITDRHFPDKAMDVLDEVGARVHLRAAALPATLREMESALAAVSRERHDAVEAATYEKAVSARLRELALRSKLDESRAEWQREMVQNPVTVTADDIREVITSMTGIPAERISQSEQCRLLALGDHLAGRVVGQEEAVERITRAIRHSRAGLKPADRPIGVFLFVGPTGVGKTLLAKELSEWLFDEKQALVRIDMSEYAEKHNASRLIGSPPGYVGYGEGGQLTEAVRRHPYAVVLLDEIEKAHTEIFNVLLQLFDEGHLTDGAGRKVDFRNTIIIMTSNVGSREAARRPAPVGYAVQRPPQGREQMAHATYRKALEERFVPEFLNRIDDVVIFRNLSEEDVARIVDIEMRRLGERVAKLGYRIKVTERARRLLASMGYESRYGARALHRTLLERVEEPISSMIVEGTLREGDTVVVESDRNGGVRLRVA